MPTFSERSAPFSSRRRSRVSVVLRLQPRLSVSDETNSLPVMPGFAQASSITAHSASVIVT